MKGKFEQLFDLNLLVFNIVGKIKTADRYVRKHYMFSVIKRNKVLENLPENKSKKCYIIGLGPSLKSVNLDKIGGDTIVLNRFFKVGEQYPSFIPTYYMLSDEQFVNKDNINDFELCLKAYSNKGTKYLLDSRFSRNPLLKQFDNENFYFISGPSGIINVKKHYSMTKPTPVFFNTVGGAIFLAICMGYKHIVLLGCDFSSFATPMPQHCYDEHKDEKLRSLSMELFCYSFAAKAHELLRKYAINNGARIVNSTKGSLIDAYPIEIDENLYK